MERLLISDDLLGLRRDVTDFFSGLPARTETVYFDDVPMFGRLFFPEDHPPFDNSISTTFMAVLRTFGGSPTGPC
jgi:hypothetical protein